MKIGYNTFGMGDESIPEVISGLEFIGFRVVELSSGQGLAAALENFTPAIRKQVKSQFRKSKVTPYLQIDLDAAAVDEDPELLRSFQTTMEVGQEINTRNTPLVVSVSASSYPSAEGLAQLARIAKEHDTILALEATYGGPFDSPDDIVDLIEEVDHPNLRMAFDVSAFTAMGFELEETIEICAPLAAVCFVQDINDAEGEVEFTLPGEGFFDFPTCLVSLRDSGYKGAVIVRTHPTLVQSDDFEAWGAAEASFEILNEALEVCSSGW